MNRTEQAGDTLRRLLVARNEASAALSEAEMELDAFYLAQAVERAEREDGLVEGIAVMRRTDMPARARKFLTGIQPDRGSLHQAHERFDAKGEAGGVVATSATLERLGPGVAAANGDRSRSVTT